MPRHPLTVEDGEVLQAPSTARRAGQWIALTTVFVAILGGVGIRLFDRDEFPTIWSGLWWSLQTVTTVGYGDHVPSDGGGRAIAAVVMLTGIGFLSVVTASISAGFVESARQRRGHHADDVVLERLDRLERTIKQLSDELRATRDG